MHEPQPRLLRGELVRVGDERPAGLVEREPAEPEQAALGGGRDGADAPGGALLLGEGEPLPVRVFGEEVGAAARERAEADHERPRPGSPASAWAVQPPSAVRAATSSEPSAATKATRGEPSGATASRASCAPCDPGSSSARASPGRSSAEASTAPSATRTTSGR